MFQKSILLLFATMVLICLSVTGCGGGSGTGSTTNNPFAGSWCGQYQISGNYNETGAIDATIDVNGKISGFNPANANVSNLQSHIDNDGNLNVSYQDNGKTISISGKVQLVSGRMQFNGTINIPSVGNCRQIATLWPKSIFSTTFQGSYSIKNGGNEIDHGQITNLTIGTDTSFTGAIFSQSYNSSTLNGSCTLDGNLAWTISI